MTELDIERERRAFVAAAEIEFRNDEPFTKRDFAVGLRTWLAAKRSMQGSAEPFTYYKEPHDGWPEYNSENEFSDGKGGGLALYTAPPAPVSAEPLSDEQITDLDLPGMMYVDIVRKVEKAHGIGGAQNHMNPSQSRANTESKVVLEMTKQLSKERSNAYDTIDRFLRNELGDDDYAEYSAALDLIYTSAPPSTDAKDSLDAARYRWLRDVSVPPHNFYLSVPDEFKYATYLPEQVDSYIDAAIAAKEAGK